MSNQSVVLQSKKRCMSRFKTILEIEGDADRALSGAGPAAETEAKKIRKLIFELEQHIEDANDSLELYTATVFLFREKKKKKNMKRKR